MTKSADVRKIARLPMMHWISRCHLEENEAVRRALWRILDRA
jgi:hypothetical protein